MWSLERKGGRTQHSALAGAAKPRPSHKSWYSGWWSWWTISTSLHSSVLFASRPALTVLAECQTGGAWSSSVITCDPKGRILLNMFWELLTFIIITIISLFLFSSSRCIPHDYLITATDDSDLLLVLLFLRDTTFSHLLRSLLTSAAQTSILALY